MAPPAPPRPAWPYQHSAAAAFRRQCATPLQQDSAELASTVAPVFYCHLSTSPRPRAVRCGADAPDDEPERRGPRAMRLAVLWVGIGDLFGCFLALGIVDFDR